MAETATKAGFDVTFSADRQETITTVDEVADAISAVDILIADLTGLSANVMFELGLRYSSDKPTILLAPKNASVPFDQVTRRIIFFEESVIGVSRLRRELEHALATLKRELGFSSRGDMFSSAIVGSAAGLVGSPVLSAAILIGGAALGALNDHLREKRRRATNVADNERIAVLSDRWRLQVNAPDGQILPTLNSLAEALNEEGLLDEAESTFRQAIRLADEVDDHIGAASLLSNLALLYAKRGEHAQAISYLNVALARFSVAKLPHSAALVRQNLAAEYASIGERQRALDLLDVAIATFADTGDNKSAATALRNRSTMLIELGDLPAAEEAIILASKLAANIDDAALAASIYGGRAAISARSGRIEEALDLLLTAFALAVKTRDASAQSAILRQLGDVAISLGDGELAEVLLRSSVDLGRESGDRPALGASLALLGTVLANMDRTVEARLALREAIDSLTADAASKELQTATRVLAEIETAEAGTP